MRLAVLLAGLGLLAAQPAAAKARTPAPPLVVGARVNPPFMFHDPDGTWRGISIDLWKRVAEEMGRTYVIKEYKSDQLRSADNKHFLPLEQNGFDVLMGVIIDADTEEFNEASSPYFFTGLSIAALPETRPGLGEFLGKMLSREFLGGAALLLLAPMLMGILIWRIERRQNKREFGGPRTRGLAAAVLWASESMVGKARPILRTWPARILTIGWTFCCIMFVSGATAKLSSELTLNQLRARVSGPKDLPNVRVGTRKTGNGMLYLTKRAIPFTPYDTDEQAVDALARGEVDATVGTAAIIQYFAAKKYPGRVLVLPGTFTTFGMGFGLRRSSPFARDVNLALLKVVESDDWKQRVAGYLGTSYQ